MNDPNTPGAIQLRIRYNECDPMGVAHHASYVTWLELGRTELLRSLGRTYADMEREGALLVVTKLEIRYRSAAHYDDVIEVRTRATKISRVKIEHAYEVALIEPSSGGTPPGTLLAEASTQLACVNREGAVTPLPDWLASATPT